MNAAAVVPAITDALQALLVARANALAGCTEGTDEEREFAAITDTVEAYEAVHWPNGKAEAAKASSEHTATFC